MTAAAGHYQDYHEQVGFGEAFKRYWSNYVNFSGRSNRGEYWWAVLALVLIGLVLGFVDGAITGGTSQPLSNIFSLTTFIPSLALGVRRLHDLDMTGWWIVAPTALAIAAVVALWSALSSGGGFGLVWLFGGLALVAGLVLLVLFCQRGTSGANRFG